ncbi:MAG: hypothetical protein RL494_1648 [Bacteroidota bacterium]|jgi:hypothetical protein
MKKIFLGLLLMISFLGFSQKIKLKKGNVLIDDIVWLKYDGCGGWGKICSISNLKGDEIIYMNLLSQPYSADSYYWKVKFLGTNQTIELEYSLETLNERLLKKFYDSKVVNDDGTLNAERVQRMVEKYDNSFSSKENLNTTQTIIIK